MFFLLSVWLGDLPHGKINIDIGSLCAHVALLQAFQSNTCVGVQCHALTISTTLGISIRLLHTLPLISATNQHVAYNKY
jgi:hypothetical protein